jgi:hypothetical protein
MVIWDCYKWKCTPCVGGAERRRSQCRRLSPVCAGAWPLSVFSGRTLAWIRASKCCGAVTGGLDAVPGPPGFNTEHGRGRGSRGGVGGWATGGQLSPCTQTQWPEKHSSCKLAAGHWELACMRRSKRAVGRRASPRARKKHRHAHECACAAHGFFPLGQAQATRYRAITRSSPPNRALGPALCLGAAKR